MCTCRLGLSLLPVPWYIKGAELLIATPVSFEDSAALTSNHVGRADGWVPTGQVSRARHASLILHNGNCGGSKNKMDTEMKKTAN